MRSTNLLIKILDILSVKYTVEYAEEYYEKHPNKFNLYGISQMLNHYQVENVGVNMECTIESLAQIHVPFLAYVENHFAIVTHYSEKNISYIFEDNNVTVPVEQFLKVWTGDALLFAKTEDSIEPNYDIHFRHFVINSIKHWGGVLILMILAVLDFFQSQKLGSVDFMAYHIFNIIGFLLCIPLMRMHIDEHDPLANKVCSLFTPKSKCNKVTASAASSLLGISLSTLGMSYFVVNLIILFSSPSFISTIFMFCIFILPFTFWSIWYQAIRLKEFCSLCIGVLVCIWGLFFSLLSNNQLGNIHLMDVVYVGCSYLLGLYAFHSFVGFQIKERQNTRITYQLCALKSKCVVFDSLLKEQPYYELNKQIGIVLGNPFANNTITIISNPHCDPCSKLHPFLVNLLEQKENPYSIQILLTSFNEELEKSCHLWIAMYQNLSSQKFVKFMGDWYNRGRYEYREYYQKYISVIKSSTALATYESQKIWLNNLRISNTPTILINGFLLPEEYELKDLVYLELC